MSYWTKRRKIRSNVKEHISEIENENLSENYMNQPGFNSADNFDISQEADVLDHNFSNTYIKWLYFIMI